MSGTIETTNIQTENIKHTNGTTAATVGSNGELTVNGETTLATHLNMGDADRIKLGTGSDLQIYHDGTDSLITNATNSLKLDSNAGTSIKIDAFGHVTKPLQPAFLAKRNSTATNLATNSLLSFATERFDQNGDFSGDTFTAPETGRYQLNFITRIDQIDRDSNWVRFTLVTSNQTVEANIIDPGVFGSDPSYWHFTIAYLADMDQGDTAQIKFQYDGGSQIADISGHSYFSGYLAC